MDFTLFKCIVMTIIKNYFWPLLIFSIVTCFFSACKGDDDMTEETPDEITVFDDAGFFILNEGANGTEAGSISFYHRDFEIAANDIFQTANPGETLGNGIKYMTIIDGKAYIVASSSNKIIIANPSDMKKLGEINGFIQPTYIVQASPDKAYVSQWGAGGENGSIKIVDLNTNTIIGSIDTRPGPQEMLRIGNNVYVTNSGGIFVDSLITKINVQSDEILKTINVGLAPTYLEADKNLDLWVLTRGQIVDPGNPDVNIKGKLHKIENDEVVLSLNVRPAANSLTINQTKDKLYFVQNGWIYEHPITNTSISLVPFIERDFYGLEVDPKTQNFIGLDAGDQVQNGQMILFDSDRIPLDTVMVGSTPGRAFFE